MIKSLLITLSLVLVSGFAFGAEVDVARDAFLNDTAVQKALAEAQKTYHVSDQTDVAKLAGQCGFVGCDTHYLVTKAVSTFNANTTTKTIAAIVTVSSYGHGEASVSIVSSEEILKLGGAK